jgi:drug/metabolite transporter (DMT)-like permease
LAISKSAPPVSRWPWHPAPAALPGLSATRAATVQLSVPAIAAFAGVVLLGEDVTLRLLLASVATLGGIAIVLAQKSAKP